MARDATQPTSSPFLRILHSRRAMLKAVASASTTAVGLGGARSHKTIAQTTPTPNATQTSIAQTRRQAILNYLYDPASVQIALINDFLSDPAYREWDWGGNPHFFLDKNDAVSAGILGTSQAGAYQNPIGIYTGEVVRTPSSEAGASDSELLPSFMRVTGLSYDSPGAAQAAHESNVAAGVPVGFTEHPGITGTSGTPYFVYTGTLSDAGNSSVVSGQFSSGNWHFGVQQFSNSPASAESTDFLNEGISSLDRLAGLSLDYRSPGRIDRRLLGALTDREVSALGSAMRPIRFDGQRSFNARFDRFNGQTKFLAGSSDEARALLEAYIDLVICLMVLSEMMPESDSIGYSQAVRNFASSSEARAYFDAQPSEAQLAQNAFESLQQIEDEGARTDQARFSYGILGSDPAASAAVYSLSYLDETTISYVNFLDLARPIGTSSIDPSNPQFTRLKSGMDEFFGNYLIAKTSEDPWPTFFVPVILKRQ